MKTSAENPHLCRITRSETASTQIGALPTFLELPAPLSANELQSPPHRGTTAGTQKNRTKIMKTPSEENMDSWPFEAFCQ